MAHTRLRMLHACSTATVRATQRLHVLALDRTTFLDLLGPLDRVLATQKSEHVRAGWPPCMRVHPARAI